MDKVIVIADVTTSHWEFGEKACGDVQRADLMVGLNMVKCHIHLISSMTVSYLINRGLIRNTASFMSYGLWEAEKVLDGRPLTVESIPGWLVHAKVPAFPTEITWK